LAFFAIQLQLEDALQRTLEKHDQHLQSQRALLPSSAKHRESLHLRQHPTRDEAQALAMIQNDVMYASYFFSPQSFPLLYKESNDSPFLANVGFPKKKRFMIGDFNQSITDNGEYFTNIKAIRRLE
jgi:hypothetical protein